LLEKIRQRAEEAELARIEAEENPAGEQLSDIMSAAPLPPPRRGYVRLREKTGNSMNNSLPPSRRNDLAMATTALIQLATVDPLDEKNSKSSRPGFTRSRNAPPASLR